jgi:hypothetical protein
MHGYEGVDLANTRNSLELVEWGPVQNFVIGSSYPSYRAWCGMTSLTFPIGVTGCPNTGGAGLSAVFGINYNLPLNQPGDPAGPSSPPNANGVAVTQGALTYNTGSGAATASGYFPFPLFDPPFDYFGGGPGSGNLVLEQNIEPGQQLANFNRYRATCTSPVRRNAARAVSTGTLTADINGYDVYNMRFTFVSMESSGRSVFYNTGVPVGQVATYQGITLNPSPFDQPANTRALWQFQSASAITNPTTPVPGTSTGFLTLFNGTPATGIFDPSIVVALSGRNFIRYTMTFRNNNQANTFQNYNSLIFALTF